MALSSGITEPDNFIKVGDLITAYHSGYWTVTSIEKRFVDEAEEIKYEGRFGKAGDQKNSLIHYELAFDSNFKPSGKKKKVNSCDAFYCHKVDEAFIKEMINNKVNEVENILSFAQKIKVTRFTISLAKLSPTQIYYAIKRVGVWLDIVKSVKSSADADHSSLLLRVLSGKDPLPLAPPNRMSNPWYELGEGKLVELDSEFDKIVEVGEKVHIGNSGPFEWYMKNKGVLIYPPTGEIFQIYDRDKKTMAIQKIQDKGFKPLEVDGKWTGCDYCGSVDCDGKECR